MQHHDTTTVNSLKALNNGNANDSVSALDSSHTGTGMCGRVPGATNLLPCTNAETTAAVTDWVQCPALPSSWASGTSPYVQVYSTTSTNGTPGVLDSFFSSRDTKPGACARYGWGPVTQASFFPLTIHQCEYDNAVDTATGGGFGTTHQVAIPLKYKHQGSNSTSCDPNSSPAGGDLSTTAASAGSTTRTASQQRLSRAGPTVTLV